MSSFKFGQFCVDITAYLKLPLDLPYRDHRRLYPDTAAPEVVYCFLAALTGHFYAVKQPKYVALTGQFYPRSSLLLLLPKTGALHAIIAMGCNGTQ